LRADDFAYVGDPKETDTWKLPIHDADHARNALARFSQTIGIPEAEKARALAKIVAASKRFGINVDEDRNYVPEGDSEVRVFPVEVRKKGNREVIVARIPYNRHSREMRGFREIIKPGAFKEHLDSGGDVIAKFEHGQHGSTLPLARRSSGTLKINDGQDALEAEIDPADSHPEGNALKDSIRRGDFKDASFGMRVAKDGGEKWTRDGIGRVREIHKAMLTDISPTLEGAYPDAGVGLAMRSLAMIEEAERLTASEHDEKRADQATRVNPTLVGQFVCFWDCHPGRLMAEHCHGCVVDVGESLSLPETTITLTGSPDDPICLVEAWRECGSEYPEGAHEPANQRFYLKRASWLKPMEMPSGPTDEELLTMDDIAADKALEDRMRMAQYGLAGTELGFSADTT
ncbi:MAG: HK97 family phage prohead protease, partial [Patescibacteria group bacterium]|nr:HK97 family phage prohead protease [Patescibacteria group bacterium]